MTVDLIKPAGVEATAQALPPRRFFTPAFWMSAGYWWYFGAMGCYFPYLALYYRQLGLTGGQIGLLVALSPLAVALLAPLWGMLADWLGIHRLILRLSLLPAAGFALLLSGVSNFASILLIAALLAIVLAPAMPLLDSYAVAIGEQQRVSYGQMRFWGSLGFTMGVLGVGWWMGTTITPAFLVAYAGCLLLTAAVTFGLPPLALHTARLNRAMLAATLRQPTLIVLLVATYMVSIAFSIMGNFFSIYLAELGAIHLIGLANVLLAVFEMPVMLAGNWLLNRFGARRLLALAILVYALRLFVYSSLTGPTWLLPAQLLSPFSYTIFLLASIRLAAQLGKRELAATAQSLLAAAAAFGSITGALSGGLLLDQIGIFAVYRLAAWVALLTLGVYVVGMRRYGR